MIRLETLIELKFLNSSFSSSNSRFEFSSLSSYWNQTNSSLSSYSRQQYLSQQYLPPSYLRAPNQRGCGAGFCCWVTGRSSVGRSYLQSQSRALLHRLWFESVIRRFITDINRNLYGAQYIYIYIYIYMHIIPVYNTIIITHTTKHRELRPQQGLR